MQYQPSEQRREEIEHTRKPGAERDAILTSLDRGKVPTRELAETLESLSNPTQALSGEPELLRALISRGYIDSMGPQELSERVTTRSELLSDLAANEQRRGEIKQLEQTARGYDQTLDTLGAKMESGWRPNWWKRGIQKKIDAVSSQLNGATDKKQDLETAIASAERRGEEELPALERANNSKNFEGKHICLSEEGTRFAEQVSNRVTKLQKAETTLADKASDKQRAETELTQIQGRGFWKKQFSRSATNERLQSRAADLESSLPEFDNAIGELESKVDTLSFTLLPPNIKALDEGPSSQNTQGDAALAEVVEAGETHTPVNPSAVHPRAVLPKPPRPQKSTSKTPRKGEVLETTREQTALPQIDLASSTISRSTSSASTERDVAMPKPPVSPVNESVTALSQQAARGESIDHAAVELFDSFESDRDVTSAEQLLNEHENSLPSSTKIQLFERMIALAIEEEEPEVAFRNLARVYRGLSSTSLNNFSEQLVTLTHRRSGIDPALEQLELLAALVGGRADSLFNTLEQSILDRDGGPEELTKLIEQGGEYAERTSLRRASLNAIEVALDWEQTDLSHRILARTAYELEKQELADALENHVVRTYRVQGTEKAIEAISAFETFTRPLDQQVKALQEAVADWSGDTSEMLKVLERFPHVMTADTIRELGGQIVEVAVDNEQLAEARRAMDLTGPFHKGQTLTPIAESVAKLACRVSDVDTACDIVESALSVGAIPGELIPAVEEEIWEQLGDRAEVMKLLQRTIHHLPSRTIASSAERLMESAVEDEDLDIARQTLQYFGPLTTEEVTGLSTSAARLACRVSDIDTVCQTVEIGISIGAKPSEILPDIEQELWEHSGDRGDVLALLTRLGHSLPSNSLAGSVSTLIENAVEDEDLNVARQALLNFGYAYNRNGDRLVEDYASVARLAYRVSDLKTALSVLTEAGQVGANIDPIFKALDEEIAEQTSDYDDFATLLEQAGSLATKQTLASVGASTFDAAIENEKFDAAKRTLDSVAWSLQKSELEQKFADLAVLAYNESDVPAALKVIDAAAAHGVSIDTAVDAVDEAIGEYQSDADEYVQLLSATSSRMSSEMLERIGTRTFEYCVESELPEQAGAALDEMLYAIPETERARCYADLCKLQYEQSDIDAALRGFDKGLANGVPMTSAAESITDAIDEYSSANAEDYVKLLEKASGVINQAQLRSIAESIINTLLENDEASAALRCVALGVLQHRSEGLSSAAERIIAKIYNEHDVQTAITAYRTFIGAGADNERVATALLEATSEYDDDDTSQVFAEISGIEHLREQYPHS